MNSSLLAIYGEEVVVISRFNRLPILTKCLEALEEREGYKGVTEFEVVVVNDSSTDHRTFECFRPVIRTLQF
jgi:hypothetical protein